MHIQLLFFAALRERLGVAHEELLLPSDILTVGAVRRSLAARGGVWGEAMAEGRTLRVALDHRLVDEQAALHEGAELAFFPPVTGG
jgi:sulfur-carrier protein